MILQFAKQLRNSERIQLMDDLENAAAESVTPDGSRVMFEIKGYQHPPYQGQHPFGIIGYTTDEDEVELEIILYADENNRLLELEVIRWGDGPILSPNWEGLVFSQK